mmetsp:Transcript_30882/g.98579  ORF Transcript_30882/g.98579 Transcript_30882/m.98579 type:complete len:317 (-) Transcript_30882:703-1653(-)
MVLHLLGANLLDGLLLPPSLIPPRWRWPLGYVGEVTSAHVVQDDSRAPHVDLHCHLLSEDLRCHVEQRATHVSGILLLLVKQLGQPEVDDLDRRALPVHKHDVLRLEVLVQERHRVHESQRTQGLLHDVAHEGLVVGRPTRLPKHVHLLLQLAAVATLHDLRNILPVIEVLVDLDDVWMVQHRHVPDLLQYLLGRHVGLPLGDLFADSLFTGDAVLNAVNDAEAALTQLCAHDVDLLERPLVLLHEGRGLDGQHLREPEPVAVLQHCAAHVEELGAADVSISVTAVPSTHLREVVVPYLKLFAERVDQGLKALANL